MLSIYGVSKELVREVMSEVRTIGARNRGLADQLERAVISVPLNLAEGSGQRGGNRRQRYLTALGSAREVEAALEVACAAGYLESVRASTKAKLDRIIGTLVNVLALSRAA